MTGARTGTIVREDDHGLPPSRRINFRTALSRWAALWGVPELVHVSLSYSSRMTKAIGLVRPSLGRVTLSDRVLDLPVEVSLEVLCHEVAHIATYLLHGPLAKPHGPEWRRLVQRAGYEPTTTLRLHDVEHRLRRRSRPRVRYECPVCHDVYHVARRSSRLRCSACLAEGSEVPLVRTSPPANS